MRNSGDPACFALLRLSATAGGARAARQRSRTRPPYRPLRNPRIRRGGRSAKQTQAPVKSFFFFENPIPGKMRFVFTSCLVPFSIAIMGHWSDSELFIYVAANTSWIDKYARSETDSRGVCADAPPRAVGEKPWLLQMNSNSAISISFTEQRCNVAQIPSYTSASKTVCPLAWKLSERILCHPDFRKAHFR